MKKPNSSLIELIHNYGIDPRNRIIYMNSESDNENGESGVDYLMAKKFIKNLDYLNSLSSEPIVVKTNNCGGCWFYGMSIFDAIKESSSPVDIYAKSWARSMSSIILQAGRKRVLSKNTAFMVHYGEYSDYGDWRKVKNGMSFYDNLNKTMFDIYASRCVGSSGFSGMSESDISSAIESKVKSLTDWWLTAEEAVFYGFADEIL